MKNVKMSRKRRSIKRARFFRLSIFAVVLLAAGVVTAIARYASLGDRLPPRENATTTQPANKYVTVEVGGKKLQVNALTLQQGPLTQDQSQQISDALKNNKSTDGLVQVQHADGTVSMDLQGRFQDVMLAKKNDDGSVSQACVDSAEAAAAFLQSREKTADSPTRKAAVKE